ncbi:MAG TPA: glycogen debranching N-terminal domain-containing protein [Rubrobacteraceae bacterium]|nr:glycogen debranching N-terminal domain-containing protein [Rubrobacteraceae bacterium]
MREGLVSVVSPGAFCVSDGVGDFDGSPGRGLFIGDVPHLSVLRLRIGGARLVPLASWVRGSEAEFAVAAGVGPEGVDVVRRRSLGGGMEEEILLANESRVAVEVRVEVECAADFRDVFELRGWREAAGRGEVLEEAKDGRLRFAYRRGGFRRGTVVRVGGEGISPRAELGRLSFEVYLEPEETRAVRVSVELEEGGERVKLPGYAPLYAGAPGLETGWEALRASWERSLEDLESLTFDAGGGLLVPAAGAPWFMALFGRDTLITGYQAMILGPEPAKNVLRALARYQATERDDLRDAEPGKIPHELRRGELAFFGEIPETPYYGTVDATPLFLVLLHEVWRWTADEEFVRELEGAARRALSWVLEHADRVGGYVAYASHTPAGLQNQGWKDSEDSMLFRDGTRAAPPIAPCEVQGYVYDAYLRTAALAERVWGDALLAAELRGEAALLKERFELDFWMEDRGYYALALDGAGRRVDSVTSNPGHLLWSGIVSPERARIVADRLMEERLFCGWGIRTMAEGEGGYDPESYHDGSVWPHDNALIVQGLRRYGLREEANRVAAALIDAAPHFEGRLPEVFAGYSREEAREPVELPRSCSPQAWAAGTVPLLVRAVLGAEPDPETRRLLADPLLPESVEALRLEGVPAFGERFSLGT